MRKVASGIVTALVMCALLCIPSHAYTAEELYNEFGLEYTDPHSTEDNNTIIAYRCAKRYVRIFGHLSAVDFTDVDLTDVTSPLQARLADIEEQLRNGFHLSIDTLYSLESEYREIHSTLDYLSMIENAKEVSLKQLDVSGIPTYSEYTKASARNALIDTQQELGNGTPTITPNAYVISNYTDSSVTVGTAELAVITSLFNGEVIDVTDDVVTINHYNSIYSSYKGLSPSVSIGDTVYQGKCIGYSKGNVSVRLRIKDTYVDIYSFLEVD